MSSRELFEEYFDSSFKKGNILTEKQYEKAACEFKRFYDGVMPQDKGAVILDIGCGAGHFLYYLKKEGFENFLGIDISVQQLEFCKKNISGKVELANGVDFLKDKSEVYDVIAAHDILEHLPKDKTILFIREVNKALKKEGIFLLRTPNMSNPFSIDSRYCDFTHEVGFTAKSLYQVLWVGGFRDITIFPPKNILVRSVRNFLRKGLVRMLHSFIRFIYYIQDFTVPDNLDKNLVAVARKK